jgi:hypothetical protein
MSVNNLSVSGCINERKVSSRDLQEVWVFHRAQLDQINGMTKEILQLRLEAHVAFERTFPTEIFEFDKEIKIAFCRFKTSACRGPEQFQARDMVLST